MESYNLLLSSPFKSKYEFPLLMHIREAFSHLQSLKPIHAKNHIL